MQTFAKPSLRDRDVAVLCLTFDLRHREGRMLAWLLERAYSSAEQLRAVAAPDKKITYGSMRVSLCSLRAKLELHGIKINTVVKLGYGLSGESRAKILKGIAEYGAAGVGARRESNQAAAPPD